MKKVIVSLFVLSCLAGAVMGQTVTMEFLDKIKAANPQDRWMPSGMIEFTIDQICNGHDEQYSYTMSGTLSFNKDHALFERHIVNGEPLKPKVPGAVIAPSPDELRLGRDMFASVGPDSYASYNSGSSAVLVRRDGLIKADNFSILNGGVLTAALLSSVDETNSNLLGNVLQADVSPGITWKITKDGDDRIVSLTQYRKDYEQTHEMSRHVQIDGKWLPQDIMVRENTTGGEQLSYMKLHFNPGNPSNEELAIVPSEGVRVLEVSADGFVRALSSRADSVMSQHRKLMVLHQYSCDSAGYPAFFHNGCCSPSCYGWVAQGIHWHPCRYVSNWVFTCTAEYYTVQTVWEHCYSIPYPPPYCQEYKCYIDGTRWIEYVGLACDIEQH